MERGARNAGGLSRVAGAVPDYASLHPGYGRTQQPVSGGALALGTWQGIYVAEHRARPHRREVVLQFVGSRR